MNKKLMNKILNTKPQAVIFDWSDTVVGSTFAVYNSFKNAVKKEGGKLLSRDEMYEKLVVELDEYLPKLVGNEWKIAKETCAESYKGKSIINMALMPWILEVIYSLKIKNIPVIVISNRRGTSLRKELKDIGLEKLFTTVIGVGDSEYYKPDPEIVYFALEENNINIAKGPVWFIGDTSIDMECAYNSSCVPILLDNNEGGFFEIFSRKHKNDNNPIFKIANYKELVNYIKQF